MMGSSSGSYKAGGSLSSSSNLSPLAPPFMVDKSFARSTSTNPSMNFPELPVYGTVFDPAGPFSSGGYKFGVTEPLCSTACPPSGGVYGYPGSQSTNSDVCYVGHNAGAGYDPFSYDQFPNGMSDRDGDDVMKSYYGPYASSPTPCKDAYVGSSYDLLSSSGAGHFTGYSSPQVDHTQGVSSGGEYKPKWTGFWGRLGDSEQEKWTEYAPSSGVKDFNLSDLSSNKNHISVDASNQSHPFGDPTNKSFSFGDASSKNHLFGCVSNKNNLKQGACVSQGLDYCGEGSTVSGNSFDIFGGTYHFGSFGIEQNRENLSFKNLGGLSNDGSRMSGFVSGAACIDSLGLQRPLLESVTNFSDSQKASGSSFENHFSQAGCSVFGCTSTTDAFPISVTDSQYEGSASSAGNALSGIQVNPMIADTAFSINPSAGQEFLAGVVIRRPQLLSRFGSSSQKGENVNDGLDLKFTSDKTTFTLQVPAQSSSNGFSPKSDDSEASCFIEKHSSESDLHNPAEDSPCWKGASSTRFSPFSVSEAVAIEFFVNQEDECKTSRVEEPQKKNLPVDTSDSVDFSEKVSESSFPKKPTDPTTCTSEDLERFHSENQKSYCIDLNIPDGLEFLDDCRISTNDSSLSSKPRSGLATEPIVKEGEVSPAIYVSQASVAAKGGYCSSAAAHKFPSVPSDDGNDSSCSTLGDEASLNNGQSTKKSPESKFDVNVVLKTMMKLSQMIRCYCLCKAATLTEQHSTALEQIINNLNASMSEMARQTRKAIILSTEGLSVSEMVNIAEVAAANKLARTAEEFLDSSEDDADIIWDDNTTQAIKKILCNNLHEGIDQPELLYRNLWLESEAALCVMTAKARFHRMKIDMEKSSQAGTKECAVENPQSPKVPSDGHGTIDLAPAGNVSPALVCDDESQKSSATNQCNDTEETSIPNSQHLLLKSRKVSEPKESRKELIFPPFLYDSSPFIFGNDSCDLGAASCANDVENSVMAGYQILKSHFADSGTLKNEGRRSSNDLLSQDMSGVNKHFSEAINHAHDVEAPVMARYQILKSHVADNETLSNESKQSSGEENHNPLSPDTSGKEGINMQVNDPKASVMGRCQILKCRMDKSSSLNEGKQSPGGESYLIGDPSSPYRQFLNPKLFNLISSADDAEASVMARFRIIQDQISGSNSVNKEPAPTQANTPAAEDGTQVQDWPQQKTGFMTDIFGPYPNFSEDQDVKKVGVSVDGEPLSTSSKINKLATEILDGWYDDYCSSSDWEHVSKEELQRQN